MDTVEHWTDTINRLHPGRVSLYVVFPVPPTGRFVLNIYRPLLGDTPAAIIPGPTAKLHEPVPYDALAPQYVDASVVDQTEALRKSLWEPPSR